MREQVEPTPLNAAGLQSGNEQAWGQLYEYPYQLFRNVTHRVGVPWEEVDDVIQDGFFKVVKGITQLKPDENPLPWITTVMKNAAIDHQRKIGRRIAPFPLSIVRGDGIEMDEEVNTYLIDPTQNPENAVMIQEGVQEVLEKLTPRERIVFVRRNEGYKDKEIAPEINLHSNTVKTVANRARIRLSEGA